MKFACRVTGHELVTKGKPPETMVKVKLRGTGSMKIEFLVSEDERVKYPFGCAATVDFGVQQSLALDKLTKPQAPTAV